MSLLEDGFERSAEIVPALLIEPQGAGMAINRSVAAQMVVKG